MYDHAVAVLQGLYIMVTVSPRRLTACMCTQQYSTSLLQLHNGLAREVHQSPRVCGAKRCIQLQAKGGLLPILRD